MESRLPAAPARRPDGEESAAGEPAPAAVPAPDARADLRLGPLLRVWAPLAATFLLVTGGTPVINAAINRLPGRIQEVDLAAFAVLLSTVIVLHSPLFVTREIAIKMSVDRAGARRAMRFCLGAAAIVAGVEILLGATPLGRALLGLFTERADIVAETHRAFLIVWPMPLLIVTRGVYQAHQIRVDDTLFVGLGTLLRLLLTAALGFLLAPRVGMGGPTLGAICLTAGLVLETVFAAWRARRHARPPEHAPDGHAPVRTWRFAVPLMVANGLGVGASLFYLRIAGFVPADVQDASLAAFQEVRPLQILFSSGAFALQVLTTAKVRAPRDERAMLRFAVLVGGSLSLLLGVLAFTPLRRVVLVDLLGEDPGGLVYTLAVPALLVSTALPLLIGVRFGIRGVLIARGHTRAITWVNVAVLSALGCVLAFSLLPAGTNGPLNAYLWWAFLLAAEICVLGWTIRRV